MIRCWIILIFLLGLRRMNIIGCPNESHKIVARAGHIFIAIINSFTVVCVVATFENLLSKQFLLFLGHVLRNLLLHLMGSTLVQSLRCRLQLLELGWAGRYRCALRPHKVRRLASALSCCDSRLARLRFTVGALSATTSLHHTWRKAALSRCLPLHTIHNDGTIVESSTICNLRICLSRYVIVFEPQLQSWLSVVIGNTVFLEHLSLFRSSDDHLWLAFIAPDHVKLLDCTDSSVFSCHLILPGSVSYSWCSSCPWNTRDLSQWVFVWQDCRCSLVKGIHMTFVWLHSVALIGSNGSLFLILELLESHLWNERGSSIRPSMSRHNVGLVDRLHLGAVDRQVSLTVGLRLSACVLASLIICLFVRPCHLLAIVRTLCT